MAAEHPQLGYAGPAAGYWHENRETTIRSRANTVLDISPRDESPLSYPFYLRDHMKGDVAPMKKVTRYAAPIIPRW